MTPEDHDVHEYEIEVSEETRDEMRENYPEHYDRAYSVFLALLRRFDYRKYQIFNYEVYDPGYELIKMNSALDMMAYFFCAQDQGAPYTDEYIKSFALNRIGCLPFVVLPGGKDND